MKRPFVFALLTLLTALSPTISAGDLTPEERAFFKQRESEMMRLEFKTLDDLAIKKVFSTPIYRATVILPLWDWSPASPFLVTRNGDSVTGLNQPCTDGDLPDFLKLINPGFKLRTNTDGEMLQRAIDVLFPLITESEKKHRSFQHRGHTWSFVRTVFFDTTSGYLVTTDASGTITAISYHPTLPEMPQGE